ncbi:hypothetical protein R1flu_001408 [Riccia fluitans]|uniref:Uncharacterized protein n=1 Tax=Riccia fluitans TaxID=41844 RepID=A0ABD1Y370_9MARC
MVTLTLKETGSSWRIKTQALQQVLSTLQEKGLNIVEVIHDDNVQLKDSCWENNLQQIGSKLCLVQRVSIHLKLPEAGASMKLQRQRPLKYPELAKHDLAYKLKSWIYTCAKNVALRGDTTPELLTMDIHNGTNHWVGDHSTCRNLPGVRKCIVENWSGEQKHKYAPDVPMRVGPPFDGSLG